jgi:hypothetical protein
MRRYTFLIILFSMSLLCGCAKTSLESNPSTPTVAPMVDSFFYGYAYLDANNNGQIDESDTPLSDVQFTANDANGASAGGKTDSEGRAMAWWPSESQYPVTLRMTPMQGYTLVGPEEVDLEQGASNAKFLFTASVITPSPETTPSERNPSTNTQYTLTAVLNYATHFLAVDEQISYTNHTTETLKDILLIVEPQRYNGVFKLNGITLGDGTAISPTWDDNWLTFPLAQPLEPDQTLQISLSYELNLPFPQPSAVVRPVPFGYTERQTNLVDWYPFIPPHNPGQGWMAHKPGYFGEHLAYEYADFQINIMVSDVPAALFADPTPAGDQPTAGYAIAASAPAQVDGDWRRYHLESARNFVWSVSHAYQVFSKVIGDVTVLGYSFPVHSKAGQTTLDVTAQSFELYQELFGPYPHKTLSVVEADFLDGMEYDGLYFLSNGFYNLYTGTPADYLTDIAAHETAHQWFFGIVGNDQGEEPWLDESLCTYSERLYYEKFSPEGLDWWWKYRINFYKPTGFIDGSIFSYNDVPNAYETYRNAVYLNGAMFMEDLRKLMGDEAFLAFMKDYVAQNQGKIVNTETFFSILKNHTQKDISPLMNKYFGIN